MNCLITYQSDRFIFWKNSSIQGRSDPFSHYWLIPRLTISFYQLILFLALVREIEKNQYFYVPFCFLCVLNYYSSIYFLFYCFPFSFSFFLLHKWIRIPDIILAHIPPLPHRLESLKPLGFGAVEGLHLSCSSFLVPSTCFCPNLWKTTLSFWSGKAFFFLESLAGELPHFLL